MQYSLVVFHLAAMKPPQFVLASASPARRRLLQSVGIDPMICPSNFDESQVQLANATELVRTLALRKAETVAARLEAQGITAPTLVLGCDSVLAIHCEIHGKPDSSAEAIARWQQMRGRVGELYTGHALLEVGECGGQEGRGEGERGGGGDRKTGKPQPFTPLPHYPTTPLPHRSLVRCQITRVQFAQVSDRQIADYVATGEPLNCAGCFALEGKGGLFVEKLEGCHSNVIGLSLPLLRQMLDELGYNVTDFWEK
jgi:septum formation protein